MSRKKISGDYGWILPTALVVGGGFVLYKIYTGLTSLVTTDSPAAPGKAVFTFGASSSPQVQAQTIATGDQIDAWFTATPTATNPFLVDLYQNDPGCSGIDQTTANNLWTYLHTASDPGIFFDGTNADLSGILDLFKAQVTQGCDLSMVSNISKNTTGKDLWDFMRRYFYNDHTGSSGQTNMQMLAAFVTWAGKLPSGEDS